MVNQTNENQNAAGRLPRLLLTLAAPVLSALIILLADLEPGKPAVTATLAVALLIECGGIKYFATAAVFQATNLEHHIFYGG